MKKTNMTAADNVGFELLGDQLGRDVRSALKTALSGGAYFVGGADPLSIYRSALRSSIRDIQTHKRGVLFQGFLREGPCEGDSLCDPECAGKKLTKEETAQAITFIYSFMVNSFKGAITELLAAAACQRLMDRLRGAGALPAAAKLFVGDAVMVRQQNGNRVLKGADMHILIKDIRNKTRKEITVAGVVEVKSGRKSVDAMNKQLESHIRRVHQGLRVSGRVFGGNEVRLGYGTGSRVLRMTVQPSDWRLSRKFRFEESGHGRLLRHDPVRPPRDDDEIIGMSKDRWHIKLKWSKEAIAEAGFEMTFWYMEKVGEVIYSDQRALPKEWSSMSPAEAGRNAVKMMLYYAIRPYAIGEQDGTLSRSEERVRQRAIALYNCYGFGYALGMNFRNKRGRREMLWPRDLKEIAKKGHTYEGCTID